MIVQNAVTCLSCGDFIYSAHRHHYNQCTCGAIAVDGGQDYLRRVGAVDACVEMSWSIPDEVYKACADAVQEAMDTHRNKYGIANAVLRKLREHDRIIADGERRVIANFEDEIMVTEADGSINRYKKVTDAIQ